MKSYVSQHTTSSINIQFVLFRTDAPIMTHSRPGCLSIG